MRFAVTAVLSLACLSFHSSYGQEKNEPETIVVGGVELSIPMPGGFARIDGVNSVFDQIQAGFLPATNLMMMNVGIEEARQALQEGSDPDLDRTLNIQVVRVLENKNVSTGDFETLKASIREEFKGLDLNSAIKDVAKKGSDTLSDVIGEKANVDIKTTGPIGILSDDENQLTFGMEMDLGLTAAGESERVKGYVAGSFLRVHGKVINLYSNSASNTPEDQKWVQDSLKNWRSAILAANTSVASVMAETPNSSAGGEKHWFSGITRSAIIGAIIGGLVGLISFLFKRRRA